MHQLFKFPIIHWISIKMPSSYTEYKKLSAQYYRYNAYI